MATRREFLAIVGLGAGAATLAGCRDRGAVPAGADRTAVPAGGGVPPGVPDPLLGDIRDGLVRAHGADRHTFHPAVATWDGSTVVAAASSGPAHTDLALFETATGRHRRMPARVRGRWIPRAVSADAQLIAMVAPPAAVAPPATERPAGREQTTIALCTPNGERQLLTLPGNYEPEAFSTDRSTLFALEWLPATAPDHYRVRAVDLAGKAARPLLTRDKAPVPPGAEEEMRGQGRQAVLAPDGQTLYTLYTHQPDHLHTRDRRGGGRPAGAHAFVHVLSLAYGWAYCLNLPDPFGHGPVAGHSLAVAPDGKQLFVADLTSGRLAVADTESLTVRQVVPVPPDAGPGYAVTDRDGRRLYLGGGGGVRVVDLAGMRVAGRWEAGGDVRGLARSRHDRLYVGYPGAVGWFDPATGRDLGRAPVNGLTGLRLSL